MNALLPPASPRILAFHLPQYHPIPENDAWWGPGFTEWRNVAKGRPLFPGHQQPHHPADLGYYDLRLPEVREQQAALAREAGIDGFVYYHYWFNGRRLLERPVNEILRLGQPDYPFCLCWANESWSRNWDGHNKHILMPQAHSPEDDAQHIAWLLTAFADPRYIKINGRPLFLVYRSALFPDIRRTAEFWRREARRAGFPDLYLCSVRSFPEELRDPSEAGMDASVDFKPNCTDPSPRLTSDNPLEIGYKLHRVFRYDQLVETALSAPVPDHVFFPSVTPSWDNSVRRAEGGVIFADATPDKYRKWLQEVLVREHFRAAQQEHLVFINAWNEWAEGNHLEPCERWGHGYLTATRAAKEHAQAFAASIPWRAGDIVEAPRSDRLVSAIERFETGAAGLDLLGWCFWSRPEKPADLLLLAEHVEGDRYCILRPIAKQRLPRPDVVRHFGCTDAASCGWCDTGPTPAGKPPPSLAVLAGDLNSARLTRIG